MKYLLRSLIVIAVIGGLIFIPYLIGELALSKDAYAYGDPVLMWQVGGVIVAGLTAAGLITVLIGYYIKNGKL